MPNATRKVRFIEPGGRAGRPFNAWIRRWPLLGGITLATILHERGFDAGVYNENVSGPLELNPAALEDVLSADVVGIGIMTATASRGYALARWIKQRNPRITTVLGGVHATMLADEAAGYADVVVRGEGETVIEPIARGQIVSGVVRAEPLADLDAIPTLNHFLMRDFDKLLAGARKRNLYELPMMTSRGCPHACTYCSVTRMFGRQVRRQSVAKVHRDIEHYAAQGFTTLFFYDDNFTTDRTWSRQLLDRMRPMHLEFKAQSRVDFHWLDGARRQRDDTILRAMRKAGAVLLYIGYETIDDATAGRWHKGYRGSRSLASRLAEDTRILHDHGMWIHGMFVLGPEHDDATARAIVDFAHRVDMETLQISILTPLPGTPMFEQMRPHLVFDQFPADWDFYDGGHCVYDHGRLGIQGTQRTILEAHRRFYGWGAATRGRVIRSLARRSITLLDKVHELYDGVAKAHTILRDWRSEMRDYLRLVETRLRARMLMRAPEPQSDDQAASRV